MSEGHTSSPSERSPGNGEGAPKTGPAPSWWPGRFGAILLVIGVIGLGIFAFTGQSSYAFDPLLRERQRKLLWAVAATLPLLFANGWVGIYLIAMGRQLRRWKGLLPRLEKNRWRWGRKALAALIVATGSLIASFLLGPAVLIGQLPPWSHGFAFWLCVCSQGAALVFGWWALVADRRLRRGLAERLS
ncbi:MAG: hypothetical protein AAGD01_02855 [Acidobacteriota bacterium]